MKMKWNKVALIGPFPPPIGGISVHIKRLQKFVIQNGICCDVYDIGATEFKAENVVPVPGTLSLIWRLFQVRGVKTIHFHGSSWFQRAALLIFKLTSKRVIYTFHSFRDEVESFGVFKLFLVWMVVKFGDRFIATGPHIRDKLIINGVNQERITTLPAFIPPEINKKDFDKVPTCVWEFIEAHDPIIAANAFRISFYKGEDLYGIDLCIELCADLKNDYPDVGLIFCLPEIGDIRYFHKMQYALKKYKLDNNFLFVNRAIELYPILTRSDIFVRPTNTDSYSVSVAESIFLGIQAVASDVCQRPEGTVLFESRNLYDLIEKVRFCINNPRNVQTQTKLDDKYAQAILNIYLEC